MKGVIKLDKKKVGQRVKLARVFYEQRTGNKMTQDILVENRFTIQSISQQKMEEYCAMSVG